MTNTITNASQDLTPDTTVSGVKKSGIGGEGKTPLPKSKAKNKRHNPQLLCKGQQFRLQPTPEQATLLRQWIGCGRYVWNWALAQQNEYNDNYKKCKHLNTEETTSIESISEDIPKTLSITVLSRNLTQIVKNHSEDKHKNSGSNQISEIPENNVLAQSKNDSLNQTSKTSSRSDETPDRSVELIEPNMGFLRSCPRTVLTNSLQHLGTAWSNFYDGVAGKRSDDPGKPVFRKRLGKNERATFQVDPRHKHPIDMDNQTVAIPGLGKVKVVLSEKVVGDLSSMTVKRKGNIWLISLSLINVAHESLQRKAHKFIQYPSNPTDTILNPNKQGVAAIDLSVVSGAVATVDGTTTFSLFNEEVLRSNEKHEQCKTKYQRVYSRKQEQLYLAHGIKRDANGAWPKNATAILAKKGIAKNTRNMEKLHEKIAVLDLHEMFRKADAIHKFTTKLVQENHTIVVETLMLYAMAKALSRGFRRRMHEACMGKIIEQLKYKCAWHNRTLIFVDKWFPSSKRCSNVECHEKNKHLLLKDRTWVCTACNTTHVRDNTAAFNLWQEGWRLLEEFFQKNNTDCLAAGSVVRGRHGVIFSANPAQPKKRTKSPKSLQKITSSLVLSG